jgi:anti-anti-sigma factor
VSSLLLETSERDGVSTVKFYGELNMASAGKATRELVDAEKGKPDVLVLDLRELEFIDSSGLRLVVAAEAGARREGRRMVIVPGPEAVQRVFRATLLDRRLEFVEDPSALTG